MTPNWQHNSGKHKRTKGMCKGKIKSRKQSLQSLKLKHLMTTISFTSGEILDIITALEIQEDKAYTSGDKHLAAYYMNMVNQFHRISDRLSERPGELRVAELGLLA